MPPKKSHQRYMLIDGHALIHRAFHAIPVLNTKSGEPTNAVFGFTSILLRAIKDLEPTHIAATFDLAAPTFRHTQYDQYKATRVKAAPELHAQTPRIKEVVRALNIPIFEANGFEADDLLGSLATKICQECQGDCDVMIVSGDLDTLQLVNKCVKIYTLRKGLADVAVYDEAAVKERYGLKPSQMVDFKALKGDPSDNIKGVAGIGEKTAAELIQIFNSVDALYKAIHSGKAATKMKPRVLELLKAQEKEARLSYELSTIKCDVPLDGEVPAYVFSTPQLQKTITLFQELEFGSLVNKLPKNYSPAEAAKSKVKVSAAAVDEIAQPRPQHANFSQDYVLVESDAALQPLLKKWAAATELAIDTETTSLNAIVADLVGVSLAIKPGEAYYVPASVVAGSQELQALLKRKDIKKIGHNIKYDLLALQNAGIELVNSGFDTMIASYLLNAGTRQHNLDTLAFNELGYQMQPIEELIGKGKKQITMDQVPVEKVSWYAAEDVDMTLRLKEYFEPKLKAEKLDDIFQNIEMPLVEILASMERQGIKLDVKILHDLSKTAEIRLKRLEKHIYELADNEFNINSPKQLKEVLFEKMGLYPVENRKVKTGLSTAADELEKMRGQHPIIAAILEYRELAKLQSTYLLALPGLVNASTGRIHTNYNQTIAATGRLSSTDPNLQNIPIRGDGLGAEVRKAFVAEKGYQLVSLDYSQIELRVVAHLSQDESMLEVFQKDEDIHTKTAMEVFAVSKKDVTADMRRDAKTINFGILYGLSSFGLSNRIGEVSRTDAKLFIDKYFVAYPKVKAYIDDIKEQVTTDGFVRNELGRVRKFPEIKSSQYFIRAAAERAAINFPIQSLAADVIKVAMINIFKEIKGKSDELRMLLQVHDELLFEVKESNVQHYIKLLKPLMEGAIKLSVPVRVEAKVGDNWGEMEKL
jgi:DNA polymerase I